MTGGETGVYVVIEQAVHVPEHNKVSHSGWSLKQDYRPPGKIKGKVLCGNGENNKKGCRLCQKGLPQLYKMMGDCESWIIHKIEK